MFIKKGAALTAWGHHARVKVGIPLFVPSEIEINAHNDALKTLDLENRESQ